MSTRPFRRYLDRRAARRSSRYNDVTAGCRDELSLIADHRRSESFGPLTL
jgi:hypothetical protein